MPDEPPIDDTPLTPTRPWPPWKAAAEELIRTYQPGDTIPHDWLWRALDLERPARDVPILPGVLEKAELQYCNSIDRLRRFLQEEYLVHLESAPGIGYAWVLPAQQTRAGVDEAKRLFGLALRKAGRALNYINLEALTDAQRNENIEARRRLGQFAALQRRQVREARPPQLPPPRSESA